MRRNLSTSEHLYDQGEYRTYSSKCIRRLPDRILTEMGSLVFILFQFEDSLRDMQNENEDTTVKGGETHRIPKCETLQQLDIFRHCCAHKEGLEDFRKICATEDLSNIFIMTV